MFFLGCFKLSVKFQKTKFLSNKLKLSFNLRCSRGRNEWLGLAVNAVDLHLLAQSHTRNTYPVRNMAKMPARKLERGLNELLFEVPHELLVDIAGAQFFRVF